MFSISDNINFKKSRNFHKDWSPAIISLLIDYFSGKPRKVLNQIPPDIADDPEIAAAIKLVIFSYFFIKFILSEY